MAQKNWKEKLNDMGIEIKEVRRTDGSVIDGWYTFEYNGILVHTYLYGNSRTFVVGAPPYPPYYDEYKSEFTGHGLCSTNFDYFIGHIREFVNGTPENERAIAEFNEKYFKMPESWKNCSKNTKSSAKPSV